ncbi:MAG: thermonuclease family protein [Rhizobiales bacterium]|nr:thermonuclease family protein [Hyphomicrobiales bacterium]
MREGWAALFSAIFCSALLIGQAAGDDSVRAERQGAAECRVVAGIAATVTAILDGRTLRLADGTELRLAGLESLADAGTAAAAETAAILAKTALQDLVRGKTITVQGMGDDRYGRRVALAAISGVPKDRPLQTRVIGQGHAVVSTRIGHPGCARQFLAAERSARAARLGLWADPHYLIQEANRLDTLTGVRGRFALVEGKVLSVNDRGATVYVNFGRRWSEDFTVTIAKRNLRSFTAAGLEPQTLAGRLVRVRGWVDERGGPWIEVSRPEQIEFADRN